MRLVFAPFGEHARSDMSETDAFASFDKPMRHRTTIEVLSAEIIRPVECRTGHTNRVTITSLKIADTLHAGRGPSLPGSIDRAAQSLAGITIDKHGVEAIRARPRRNCGRENRVQADLKIRRKPRSRKTGETGSVAGRFSKTRVESISERNPFRMISPARSIASSGWRPPGVPAGNVRARGLGGHTAWRRCRRFAPDATSRKSCGLAEQSWVSAM